MPPIKIYGLLGYPVGHSFSPVMHNAAFRHLKIKAKYRLFAKKSEELKGFLQSLPGQNICGLNVTIPYKENAITYLSGYRSYAVNMIGAANTIMVDKNKRLKGFNTDYLGFIRHIKELKIKPKRTAVIGAGGAAKAVIFALLKNGVKEISVYDIDKYKSLSLAKRFRDNFPESKFLVVAAVKDLNIEDKDLLINASPIGMHAQDPCLVSSSMLHPELFVYDLIYNPLETPLLKLAKDRGCRYANGLGMLLYQGVESFNIWMKPKKAPVEIMRKALTKEICK